MYLYTVEPLNNGHSGDRPLVHCREVVPISEGTECMLQSVRGKQFVRSTEVASQSVNYWRFHCTSFYATVTCACSKTQSPQ